MRRDDCVAAQGHVETIRDYIRNSTPQWETPIPFPAAEAWDAVTALADRLAEAEAALRAAREDCHPSVKLYFKRFPEADT